MSHMKTGQPSVSNDGRHSVAILFDDAQSDAFLDVLDEIDHITNFYVITGSNKLFQDLKAQINDLLEDEL